MNATAAVTALIRTGVPYLVAWLLALPAAGPVTRALGVTSATASDRLSALLVLVLGTLYYAAARALERWRPSLGLLLGVPSPPSYAPAPPRGTTYPSAHELAQLVPGARVVLVRPSDDATAPTEDAHVPKHTAL